LVEQNIDIALIQYDRNGLVGVVCCERLSDLEAHRHANEPLTGALQVGCRLEIYSRQPKHTQSERVLVVTLRHHAPPFYVRHLRHHFSHSNLKAAIVQDGDDFPDQGPTDPIGFLGRVDWIFCDGE